MAIDTIFDVIYSHQRFDYYQYIPNTYILFFYLCCQTVSLPIAEHVFPFSIPSGSTSLAAVGTSRESQEISTLYEISTIDTNSNDFYSK